MSNDQNILRTYILFGVAGTTYAVRSELVLHLEMVTQITPVPNAPPFVQGVVFSRGQVVPVINLRARFGFERAAPDLRTRLVVLQHEERRVGLMVDDAREFVKIPDGEIKPPGAAIAGLSGDYIDGIATLGERIVLVLKLAEVLETTPTSVA